jgi:hypothetical protein
MELAHQKGKQEVHLCVVMFQVAPLFCIPIFLAHSEIHVTIYTAPFSFIFFPKKRLK